MANFQHWTLPLPVVSVGGGGATPVSLSSILTTSFGAAPGIWSTFFIAYTGADQLGQSSYWDPNNPSVSTWSINGNVFAEGINNQQTVSAGNISGVLLNPGNNIGPFAYLAVPASTDGSEYIQYSVQVINPNVYSPVAGHGEPTPQDIVNTAHRFDNYYGDLTVPNTVDCHFIAQAIAAATGASLTDTTQNTDNPALNDEEGFWRIAYRGSDPNPVTNWQTLVQPGDIVRMAWEPGVGATGVSHTATVLAVNSDGSIVVYDNADYDTHGTEFIGIHTVNYETSTIPQSITIYRLTTDGLYLENGTADPDIIPGTIFNDHILGMAGNDTLYGAGGNDLIQGGAGNDTIDGGAGFDTAVYSGAHANYTITHNPDGSLTVIDNRAGSPDGTDHLSNIDALRFSDSTVVITGTHDLNHDGTTDLFWQNAASGATSEWLMSAAGGMGSNPLTSGATGWHAVASGDFNGDGTTDYLWQNNSSGLTAEWLMSPSGGASPIGLVSAAGWTAVASGDFNGDGIKDVLWQNNSTGATSEWLMSASGGIGSNPGTGNAIGYSVVATGDFNGDGTSDLLWQNTSTGAVSEWLMSASGGVGSNPGMPSAAGWTMVAAADFNDDGTTDILWQNNTTGATSEWLMSKTGGVASNPGTALATGWSVVAVGDFNGDGAADLLWQNNLSGATSEWLMSKNGGLGSNPGTGSASGYSVVAAGDFNGDGIKDILWQNTSTGATSEWLMSASGGVGSNPGTGNAIGYNVVAVGDFNGDGNTDIMWQKASNGATSEWLMSSSGGVASNPGTGLATGYSVVGSTDMGTGTHHDWLFT
jgi:hypothetical protein